MEDFIAQETADSDSGPVIDIPADIPYIEWRVTRSMTKDMPELEKDSENVDIP